jgi:membrane protein
MSFYFVLSLFPFFLIVAGFIGWLPSTTLWQSFVQWIIAYLPAQSRQVVFETILGLSKGSAGFVSFGILATFWTASSGFVSLMESLSRAYGVTDTRGFWVKRGIAAATTLVAAIFLIASFGLLALGHWLAVRFSGWVGDVGALHIEWVIARGVATLALLCIAVNLANYFLPHVPQRRWHWVTPGTFFVAIVLIGSTAGFNLYFRYVSNVPKVYGALAGFIMLLLWIYFTNLILLLGAQIDRVLEKMAASGAAA